MVHLMEESKGRHCLLLELHDVGDERIHEAPLKIHERQTK